jgi:hypothetical protein
MKLQKPTIIWEKWSDPMLSEEDQPPIRNSEDYDDAEQPIIKMKQMKMLVTPMGMIPYTENMAASNIFNFWVGHTNFDICDDIAALIEESEGVETLDIFTRYRFRVGIGKVFDDGKVMRNINTLLYKHFDYDKSTNE